MNLTIAVQMMFSTPNRGDFITQLFSIYELTNSIFHSDHKFYSLSHNSNTTVDGSAHARRHSVGTFAGKDKICTTSFIDEAPLELAPKAPSQFRRTTRGEFEYELNQRADDLV
jgi:hypothetical protein